MGNDFETEPIKKTWGRETLAPRLRNHDCPEKVSSRTFSKIHDFGPRSSHKNIYRRITKTIGDDLIGCLLTVVPDSWEKMLLLRSIRCKTDPKFSNISRSCIEEAPKCVMGVFVRFWAVGPRFPGLKFFSLVLFQNRCPMSCRLFLDTRHWLTEKIQIRQKTSNLHRFVDVVFELVAEIS